MLTLLLGTDWTANRDAVLQKIARDVRQKLPGRIYIVPELISHDTERRLCIAAGDTVSRFAEVVSFSRLGRRVADAIGVGTAPCLDDGGRVVAMASAVRQLHSKLKAYASVETKPEFLTGLVDAVDEFKCCCITAADLANAAKQSEGSFAQKLEELALIYDAYDGLCTQGKRDPRDQMTWLLEQLKDSDFAKNHVFYIDGFPDFTRQHMAILEHLIRVSPNVHISLNCDEPNSAMAAFEKAGETAGLLLRYAKKAGIPVRIERVTAKGNELARVCTQLFQGQLEADDELKNVLQVSQFSTIYEECQAAAQRIMGLVQEGARYRDVSLVCGDMGAYRNTLEMVFNRYRIPLYLTGTEDVLEKNVIHTVLTALDAAMGGLEQGDVIRYLRAVLSPVDMQACDNLENYAILWNIQGSLWQKEWTLHPDGLGERWTDEAKTAIRELNCSRAAAIDPLLRLQKGLRSGKNVQQMITALYAFLEELDYAHRLNSVAEEMDAIGDNRNAQILAQLWDILLQALEQLNDVLGQTAWDPETFVRLLKLLLGQYSVGTIPPVLDAVTAGPVSAMRCQQTDHLLVLGALEGNIPGYAGSAGILTDTERTALRTMGVPLSGGSIAGLQAEFAEIYGVFCGAQESVYVSCPSGQPSFLYRRLRVLAGGETTVETLGTAQADPLDAAALLLRSGAADTAKALSVAEAYRHIDDHRNHTMGDLNPGTVKKLYGEILNLSASQIDKQADCRLSYFLKYGMKAKERKTASVDPAEFGTYVHAVLEKTAQDVKQLGGFVAVSLEQTLQIADRYAEEYIHDRFEQIDSERLQYLFKRNSRELTMVVTELWQELQKSQFTPIGFEVGFGDGGDMPSISIPGQSMDARLRGFVDRVDTWKTECGQYFRVVDYKTGRKDFDYCDVFNGLGLQMLLYMFALEDGGESVLGERSISAGVQYFPARVPLVPADGPLTEEEAAAAREKLWKRSGLILHDEDVLQAMEPGEKQSRLGISRKKDGSVSGDVADRSQFRLLKAYIYKLLGRIVDEIASGKLQPNPYTRGSLHNACAFCPYGVICHPEELEGRRDYKAMNAGRFWEEIEREMSKNG